MSKVSFREIVTMRTAEPIFKDGVLEGLLCPTPKEPSRRDRNSIHEGALVPASAPDISPLDPSMQRQMQHQGRSIDQISNSVNNLQDTMTDLKHSFTALRIELNGPNRHMGGYGPDDGPGFDMIATVLKELKSKSEEIEKLKLEIEALKLKNRFMEDRKPNLDYPSQVGGALPEVRSPGLLQAGRKRAWPDAFPDGHTQPVADSFDEEDVVDDLSLSDLPVHARTPFVNSHAITNGSAQTQSTFNTPHLGIESARQHENPASSGRDSQPGHPDQSPAKRQRLGEPNAETTEQPPVPEKRRVGRPRKSVSQTVKPNTQTPVTTPPNPQEATNSNPPVQVPVAAFSPSAAPNPRGRPRRGRPPSRGPSVRNNQPDTAEKEQTSQEPAANAAADSHNDQRNGDNSSNGTNGDHSNGTNGVNGADDRVAQEERRKSKVAARDVLTRMAMQREEAMETDDVR